MELTPPDLRYRDSFLDGLHEKVVGGGFSAATFDQIVRDFAGYLARDRARADGVVPFGSVPDRTYWMIADSTYVGRITLRFQLNPSLEEIGGNVGYDVRAGHRRRGYATSALAQLLPIARARGLARLLITVDDTNRASIRVIEANRGVLRDVIQVDDRAAPTRRYWIDLGGATGP